MPVTCVTSVSHRGTIRIDCREGGRCDNRDPGRLVDALVLGRRVEALEPGLTERLDDGLSDALDGGRMEALEEGLRGAL